jgi:Class III cytochrome C family
MCSRVYKLVVVLFMLMTSSVIGVASAASIETLLMPGKVTNAHAKLESTCSNCHDRTNKVSQTALCLDCHKDVAGDMQKRAGFHGRLPNVSTLQCQGCHTEHQGRDADIVKFVTEQFDHQHTDFPLRDAHATLTCGGCHQAGKKYREAPTTCVACHKKDEPHQGQLGNDMPRSRVWVAMQAIITRILLRNVRHVIHQMMYIRTHAAVTVSSVIPPSAGPLPNSITPRRLALR